MGVRPGKVAVGVGRRREEVTAVWCGVWERDNECRAAKGIARWNDHIYRVAFRREINLYNCISFRYQFFQLVNEELHYSDVSRLPAWCQARDGYQSLGCCIRNSCRSSSSFSNFSSNNLHLSHMHHQSESKDKKVIITLGKFDSSSRVWMMPDGRREIKSSTDWLSC